MPVDVTEIVNNPAVQLGIAAVAGAVATPFGQWLARRFGRPGAAPVVLPPPPPIPWNFLPHQPGQAPPKGQSPFLPATSPSKENP